jgi:6-phosphogluconolactonase
LAKDKAACKAGRFTVALAGGSTPRSLYSMLASSEFVDRISWPQVYLFWSDERCVPPDHADSNYRMANESLISRVPIPVGNIHRMEGEGEPKTSASRYEAVLKRVLQLSDKGIPRFDLVLLGMGEDGHTASLFPDSEALQETKRLVTAVYVEKLKSYRFTLTLPVLNHAANVFFLVAGESKAGILRKVFLGNDGPEKYPVLGVKPQDGRVLWFADQAAASLSPELLQS